MLEMFLAVTLSFSLLLSFWFVAFEPHRQSEAATLVPIDVRRTSVCRARTRVSVSKTVLSIGEERQTEVCRTCLVNYQNAQIDRSYDSAKDKTTVRLAPIQISGPKARYHSLHFEASYTYPGHVAQEPETIEFELRSVVKARKLKIDLYVVFVVDGERIFLSSNRSAVRNPVPGKRWIGERLVFHMPYEVLIKLSEASAVEIRMDAISFELGASHLQALREFAKQTKAQE